MKTCTKCNVPKPLEDFWKKKAGLTSRCKVCLKEIHRLWHLGYRKPTPVFNDIKGENWKCVVGFPNYMVSDLGRIKSLISNIELKVSVDRDGYYRVGLYKDKKYHRIIVSRAVAISFIPNPENKSEVNHIDGIKSNNHVDNLEWSTSSENSVHSWKLGLQKKITGKDNHMWGRFGKLSHRSKPVIQMSLNGDFIKEWDSVADIRRSTNFQASPIQSACRGLYKSSYGFKWKYKKS